MAGRDGTAKRGLLSPARVAGVFLVIAITWIVGSDALLSRLIDDQTAMPFLQTVKGTLFVSVTALVIWALTRRLTQEVRAARGAEEEAAKAVLRRAAAEAEGHAAMVEAMTEVLPVGIALVRADDSAFLSANAAFRSIAGVSGALPSPAVFRAGLEDPLRPDPTAPWRQLHLRRPDGGVRIVTLRETHIPGQPLRVLVLQDITERQRQYAALRDSEESFRALFEQAAVGIAHTGSDGRFLRVNRRYAELVGRPVEALRGMNWQDVSHPGDVAADLPQVEDVYAGRRASVDLEKRYQHPDGTIVWARVTVSAVRDVDDRLLYLMAVSEDITARKHMEEDLVRTVEELRRSNEELERFAHLASHDLKEPTRTLVSFGQLLERRLNADGRLDAETADYLDHLITGALRMRQIVDDLMVYARSDTRQERFRSVDLHRVVEAALLPLRDSIEAEGADVRILEPLPMVQGLDTQIVQLFGALLSNALKFRHPDRTPQITVAAAPEGDLWRIEITDNGIGFDQNRASDAFRLFQRLHGPGVTPGSGIGLALCRRIVERHGGTIALTSQRGDGTRVSFTLPAEVETVSAAL